MLKVHFQNPDQKEFGKLFDSLCGERTRYQVWSDIIHMFACSISNAVDPIHKDEREKKYLQISSRYSSEELNIIAKICALIMVALKRNTHQDFLGSMYMRLNLGNQHTGQFFTPYHVSAMMARINLPNATRQLDHQNCVSVVDPCVGGGAMLIAFANACQEEKIDFTKKVLFVGQDIDHTAGLMAYIQLSLLGCPGYIVIGDSLTEPMTGDALLAPMYRETYITPAYPKFFKVQKGNSNGLSED